MSHSLSKRLLFPAHSSNELPPLLVSHSVPRDFTDEVYDFIALALRAFVNPWWTKITRYDKEFLPEISRILTVVFRSLEQRVLAADLPALMFRDIPSVITQHYRDYRNAQSKLCTSYASGGALSLPHFFHQLQPHIALSPDGTVDPNYVRQLVDHILKVCLPPEDYEPQVERFIVREIILKILLDDVIPKISQPWFIHKAILDTLDLQEVRSRRTTQSTPFSSYALLVIFLSAIQSLSGACLALIDAYKQMMTTIKLVNQSSPFSLSEPHDYAYPFLLMASEVLVTSERFAASIIVSLLFMASNVFSFFLDRFLPYMLMKTLSLSFLLKAGRIAKKTMFPNGYPASPPIEPSLEEQATMRTQLLEWRGTGATSHLVPLILGPESSTTMAAVLDPLSSVPCNVHLIIAILDTLLLSLFPELVHSEL